VALPTVPVSTWPGIWGVADARETRRAAVMEDEACHNIVRG